MSEQKKDAQESRRSESTELEDEALENASGGADSKYFVADSFSFGVEREMKESGEKGGTEDINIGVGELQESTDASSDPTRLKQ